MNPRAEARGDRAGEGPPPPGPERDVPRAKRPGGGHPVRVIISGGWTGGHVFCALAILEALRRARPEVEVLLVGSRAGIEVGLAREAGVALETVWISGIDRKWTWRALARNLTLPVKAAVAWSQARRIVARFRPTVVIGVGAYASAPLVAEAQRLGLPTLIHEANALPGIANRLLGLGARVICLGTPEAAEHFRWSRARKVVTGTPVRCSVTAARTLSRTAARARAGLDPARRTLLVLGGSLGSRHLNDWVIQQQRAFGERDLQVLWQSGQAHHQACRARLTDDRRNNLHLVPFLDDMATAYAAADLVVAGAGALSVAELAALAKPAVFVPDRGVTDDHQTRNTARVEAAGGAVCLDDALDGRLFERVAALLVDDEALHALGTRLATLASPDAAARIVAEIGALCGEAWPPYGDDGDGPAGAARPRPVGVR